MELDDLKLRVLKFFIDNAQAGELQDVLQDIVAITSPEILQNEEVQKSLLEFYTAHGQTIQIGDDLALVSPYSKQEEFHFDPKLGKKFTFDPITLELGDIEDIFDLGQDNQRALQNSLDSYLTQFFNDKVQGRVYFIEDVYHVFVTSPNPQPQKLWSGEWLGNWTINNNELQGKISMKAHFYEDGNLMSSQGRDFSCQVSPNEDPDVWAEEVVGKIKSFDQEFQEGLHSLYQEISESFFKNLRRAMPITKTRFAEIKKAKLLN